MRPDDMPRNGQRDSVDDGGPAFPEQMGLNSHGMWVSTRSEHPESAGMSLRDYFAAKALQGLVTNGYRHFGGVTKYAYEIADAMLAERSKS